MSSPRKRGSSLSAGCVLDGRWTPACAGVTLKGHPKLAPMGEDPGVADQVGRMRCGKPVNVMAASAPGVSANLPAARQRPTPHPSRFARQLPRSAEKKAENLSPSGAGRLAKSRQVSPSLAKSRQVWPNLAKPRLTPSAVISMTCLAIPSPPRLGLTPSRRSGRRPSQATRQG